MASPLYCLWLASFFPDAIICKFAVKCCNAPHALAALALLADWQSLRISFAFHKRKKKKCPIRLQLLENLWQLFDDKKHTQAKGIWICYVDMSNHKLKQAIQCFLNLISLDLSFLVQLSFLL